MGNKEIYRFDKTANSFKSEKVVVSITSQKRFPLVSGAREAGYLPGVASVGSGLIRAQWGLCHAL